MLEARFFPNASLSIVEHVLRHTGPEPAVIAVSEGSPRTVSWTELATEVGAMAAALTQAGVAEGARVAAWLPNGIEAAVAMVGGSAGGAWFAPTSPASGAAGGPD